MKFKKSMLVIGSLTAVAAPVASVVACGTADQIKPGGVFTEYVRAHDLALSLGVAPQYHARSDIMSTHGLTDEGYLSPFSDDKLTKNGKRYNGGDREYFSSLQLGAYVARSITDSKGFFTDVDNKYDVKNSHEYFADKGFVKGAFNLNWKGELDKLAGEFDSLTSTTIYTTRAKEVETKWGVREAQLKRDAIDFKAAGNDVTVLLVRGNDDENVVYDQVIGESQASELYGLDGISMPIPADENSIKSYKPESGTYSGTDQKTGDKNLAHGFAGKADVVVYLKTPNSNISEAKAKEAMKPFMRNATLSSSFVMGSYDNWYLPFRGAAIGANIVMDNIEKDIFHKTDVNTDWKSEFAAEDLTQIWAK